MPRKSSTQVIIYRFVCENPGCSTYYISKKLKMSGGKVRYALARLAEKGLIKFKFDKKNPRIRKLSYPNDFWSLLPKKIKINLKKMLKSSRSSERKFFPRKLL